MRNGKIQDIYELTPLQHGMLFHSLYTPGIDVYNIQLDYAFRGHLDEKAFHRAWQQVVVRHSILRTGFVWENLEQPYQVVHDSVVLNFARHDWSSLTTEQQDTALATLAQEDKLESFSQETPPLLRLTLVRLSELDYRFICTFHHMIMEGWSAAIVLREVGELYEGFSTGVPVQLEPALPYSSYIRWIQKLDPSPADAFWRKSLKGFSELNHLPMDKAQGDAPPRVAYCSEQRWRMPTERTRELNLFAKQNRLTLATICQGAWALLLSRYTHSSDIVFGVVLSGRSADLAGVDSLVGVCVNTLPARVQVDANTPLVPWLKALQRDQAELRKYEHSSIVQAQSYSEIPHGQPMFETLVVFQNWLGVANQDPGEELPREELMGGVELRGASIHEGSDYPLTLAVSPGPQLTVDLRFDPQRFQEDVVVRMQGHLDTLLRAFITEPEPNLGGLPILTGQESEQLLVDWNDTRTDYPRNASIAALFEEQVDRTPDALAVVYGQSSLTYEELDERANRLARYLRGLGVGPEVLVGLCVERSLEMVVGVLGILKAGGAYVPLDPEYPTKRLAFMLKDTATPLLLVQSWLEERLPAYGGTVVRLDADWGLVEGKSTERVEAETNGSSLAYVMYTSGSTGVPKGVCVEQHSVVRLVKSTDYLEFGPQEVFLQYAPISFDASTLELWGSLLNGAKLVVCPAGKVSLQELGRVIEESGVSTLWLTAALFAQMVETEIGSLRGVRQLLAGGEKLSAPHVKRMLEEIGEGRLINGYGPTENTTFTCCHVMTAASRIENNVPIGRPISNTRVYILDERMQPVPVGVYGELYTGGEGVAREYLHQPELTAKNFISDPFDETGNGRLYRTGDWVRYLENGTIEFLGRRDDQVKLRGHRIELGEVEATLCRHRALREAVVTVREDVPGDQRLVGYVVAEEESGEPELDLAAQLRSDLRETLPGYMVPSALVLLEKLPLTANGKVDREALPEPCAERQLEGVYVAPRTETEVQIAEVWRQVLGLDQVGVHDNFFELGGHSLLAVSVIERMRQADLHAEVRTLFSSSTVAALAASLGNGIVEAPPNLIPPGCEKITPELLPLVQLEPEEIERVISAVPGGVGNVQDIYPLAPLQEGIFFHHLMAHKGDPYLAQVLLRFDRRADLDRYVEALQAVIERHDILRTAVLWEGLPEPVQVVWRRAPVRVEEVGLDPGGGDAEQQMRKRISSRSDRIDVRQAPLLRLFIVYDEVNSRWVMLQLFHHLAIDLATVEVIQQEIQAHLLGKAEQLPRPQPFRNIVVQSRLGVPREEHETFFKNMLSDVGEPTTPFGFTDVHGDGSGINEAHRPVDVELAQRLRARARALGVSVASVCHLAWAQVLARVSGHKDVVFGTVLRGRMQGGKNTDRALGLAINTLPMRVHVGEVGVEESVREVHSLLAELLHHEHAPLALAQRCSAVAAPTPLFTGLLNYRHSAVAAQSSKSGLDAWSGVQFLGSEGRTNYPLTLSIDDLGEAFVLTVQVQAPIDPVRVCNYMHQALEGLTSSFTDDPGAPLRSIDVLPAAERQQVIWAWNETASVYPRDKSVLELVDKWVERTPDALAVAYDESLLSYQELDAQANGLADWLQTRGVGQDVPVGVLLERSPMMIAGWLGILKAGGAYVPLDPGYPEARLTFMLADCGATVLLTQASLKHIADEFEGELLQLDRDWPAPGAVEPPVETASVSPESLAYIMYTSGSTGKPKGVAVEHRGLVNLVHWHRRAYGVTPDDRASQYAGTSFDASVWEVWPYLATGASVHLVGDEVRHAPGRLLSWLAAERITMSFLPTPIAEAVLREPLPEGLVLQVLLTGGDRLHEGGPPGLPFRLVNHYGPTENTVVSTCTEVVPKEVLPAIGRPIDNVRVYVLDECKEPVPVGVPGELYLGGDSLARGYWNRPELTAERFMASPFNAGERLYRTGDRVRYRSDGAIEFLGRVDHQVKLRGYRIELGEIESVLGAQVGVAEATVVCREDEPGDKRLVAYVVGAAEAELSTNELREHMREQLPGYMVPSALVILEELPLTANGKMDRAALPAPEGERQVKEAYLAPRTATEEIVTGIWAEVLGLERVGVQDNFFELGGHSLLAVSVIERMRQAGMHTEVRTLFSSATIAELVAAMGQESGTVVVPPNGIPPGAEAIMPEMLPLVKFEPEEIECVVRAVPGGAANVQDIYPLAPLQEGILFHHLMAREGDPYLLSALVSFDRRADLDRHVEALQSVIGRHDILRTAVLWEGLPEPVQVVWRRASLEVEEVSLDMDGGDAEQQMRKRVGSRSDRLDVRRAPLLRLFIAHDEPNMRWVMLQLFHHLAIDHTTLEVVQQEVQAHLLGKAEQLPRPRPFRNFVAQSRLGVPREEHEAFFKKMLGDVDAPTAPYGLADVHGDGTGIAEARRVVNADLSRQLRERGRTLGVSAASVCHLAWAQVLARVSGRRDVVFGTVLLGRMQGGEGTDRTLGLFINTLPVRLHVGESSVEESVWQAHKLLAQLLHHEHAPLALAQRCSAVAAPVPLFSGLLNYRHSATAGQITKSEQEAWAGVQLVRAEERTNYPLVLSVDDLGEDFVLTAQVRAPIDPTRICNYMYQALDQLVTSLADDPSLPLCSLDVLPFTERQQAISVWNQTVSYATEGCLHEHFETQAERTPDAVAVVCDGEALSYAELNRRANRLAHHLRALGVVPNQLVGLRLERNTGIVVGILGILKSGGAYLPLDPAYPKERVAFMLEDSAVQVVVTEQALASDIEDLGVKQVLLEESLTGEAANPVPVSTTDDLAYVIYTSGSTGTPKGVLISHANVQRLFTATEDWFQFDQQDVWTLFHSCAFDFSVWELWGALLYGGRLVVVPYLVSRSPEAFRALLVSEGVTVLNQTPSAFRQLMQADQSQTQADLALRYVIFGGEALELQSLRPWLERYGDEHPQLVNMYGITETTVHVTYRRIRCADLDANHGSVIGRPIPDLQVYIIDPYGEPTPIGVPGEMYIGGAGVSQGYLNRPDLTADKFVANPFGGEEGVRLYRSGDRARRLENGDIEFLGRLDDQVKLRGHRIELGEVESALSRHPAVREAAALVREDIPGDQRLVGYVVTMEDSGDPEAELTAQLRSDLRETLPGYMVPSVLVLLEELPLTANGKVDREVLPEPGAERQLEAVYVAPRTETEVQIAEVWRQVLGLDQVGVHDNFFDLGGHSLKATQVVSRVRAVLGVDLALAQMFERQTLAELASYIEARHWLDSPPDERDNTNDEFEEFKL